MNRTEILVVTVKQMRAKQREYFRTRDVVTLREAKQLEGVVDGLLEHYNELGQHLGEQKQLF